MFDWARARDAAEAFLAIGGTVVLLWRGWKAWGPSVKAHFKAIQEIRHVVELLSRSNLPEMSSKLAKLDAIVSKELTPNGGGSILDMIRTMQTQQVIYGQQLEVILEPSQTGTFVANLEGDWTHPSRMLCDIFRRNERQLYDGNWIAWIDESQREKIEKEWKFAIAGEREFDRRFLIYLPDSTTQKIHMKTYRILDPRNQELKGYFGHVVRSDR